MVQQMLLWALRNDSTLVTGTIYDLKSWDWIGAKLWESDTTNDKAKHLASCL